MSWLDMRIPPALVLLAAGLAMWALARQTPGLALALPFSVALTAALAVVGSGLVSAGIHAFRRQKTTVDPRHPGKATALVKSGIYKVSRNPMYLGMALLLAGYACHLENLAAFAIVPIFVIYIDRFQIAPEERALAAQFGETFAAYRQRVGRWI